MVRTLVGLVWCLMVVSWVHAQSPVKPVKEVRLDGLKLGTVPDVLYAQVPDLPAGKGVLVLDIVPGSTADTAGLRRNDVLLSVGAKPLDQNLHAVDVIVLSGPAREVSVVLFRAGREKSIRIARSVLLRTDASAHPLPLKVNGPPAVTVEAKPLEGDRMHVTFRYFAKGTDKLASLNCSGSVDEIKKTVKHLGQKNRMSPQVQDLAELTLERIRVLNSSSKK